jgi:uncharacterized protein YuzE
MRITYDDDADALYLYLGRSVSDDRPVARSVVVDDDRVVDLGEDGKPVGIEVLSASRGVHLSDLMAKFDLWSFEGHFRRIEAIHFSEPEFA